MDDCRRKRALYVKLSASMPNNQLLNPPQQVLIAVGVISTARRRYIAENIIRITILMDNNIVCSDDEVDALDGTYIESFLNVSS